MEILGRVLGAENFHETLIWSNINQILKQSIQQSDNVMTEREYYVWSNKFSNRFIHASAAAFFTKIYIASFVFEFFYSILTKQCHCTNHEMQAANSNMSTKNERYIILGGQNLAPLKYGFLP